MSYLVRNIFLLIFLCLYPILQAQPNLQNDPNALLQEANQLTADAEYLQAIKRLGQAIDLFSNQVDLALQAEIWHKLGINYYYASDLDKAANAVGQAIERRPQQTAADRIAVARSLFLRAAIRQEQDNLVPARSDLKRAIALMEKDVSVGEDERNTARLMNMYMEYCRLNWLSGDYSSALRYGDKAFRFFQRDESSYAYNLAKLHMLRGQIFRRQKKYQEAITEFESAKDLWALTNDIDDQTDIAAANNNQGLVYLDMGATRAADRQFTESINQFQQLLEQQKLPYYHQELSNVSANLIRSKTSTRSESLIRDLYLSGIREADLGWKSKYNSTLPDLHLAYATYFGEQGRYDSAYFYLKKGQALIQPTLKNSNNSLTRQAIGDKNKLLEILKAKLKFQKAAYDRSQNQASLKTSFQTTLSIDSLLIQMRLSYEIAQSKYDQLSRENYFYEEAIETALALFEKTGEQAYLENAYQFAAKNKLSVLLEGLQNEDAKSFAGIPKKLLQEERKLKRQYYQIESQLYDSLETGNQAQINSLQDELFETSRAYRQFIDQLEKEYPAYHKLKYAFAEQIKSKELQSSLPSNSLLIEYFIGENQLFIFAISKEKIQYYRQAIPTNFVETCASFRELSSSPSPNLTQFSVLGNQLFKWLLASPLEDADLQSKQRLIIIPDHVLLQIPFEAFLSAEVSPNTALRSFPFVLQDYAVSYSYSNQFLLEKQRQRQISRRHKFAGFGLEYDDFTLKSVEQADLKINEVPAGQRAFGPLVYADDEVLEIAEQLGGDTWVNDQATKTAFLENAPNYHILHLSMHGLVDEDNPLSSALVFSRTPDSSDYLLKASELFSLDLSAEMAVLSACNTAYGPLVRGEGIRSLSRAFTYAGCSSLIASLWSAPDKSSMDILTNFYQHLQQGKSKDIALQQAKIAYLEAAPPTLSGPSHWAHLIQVGSASPMNQINNSGFGKKWWLGLVAFFVLLLWVWRSRK